MIVIIKNVMYNQIVESFCYKNQFITIQINKDPENSFHKQIQFAVHN